MKTLKKIKTVQNWKGYGLSQVKMTKVVGGEGAVIAGFFLPVREEETEETMAKIPVYASEGEL